MQCIPQAGPVIVCDWLVQQPMTELPARLAARLVMEKLLINLNQHVFSSSSDYKDLKTRGKATGSNNLE